MTRREIERNILMRLRSLHHRAYQRMQERLADRQLSFGMPYLMKLINNNPHWSQKQLAKAMLMTDSAMSQSLKKLIKGDYVEKTPNPKDLRSFQLQLTPRGIETLELVEGEVDQLYHETFSNLDEDELEKLELLLKKLTGGVDD